MLPALGAGSRLPHRTPTQLQLERADAGSTEHKPGVTGTPSCSCHPRCPRGLPRTPRRPPARAGSLGRLIPALRKEGLRWHLADASEDSSKLQLLETSASCSARRAMWSLWKRPSYTRPFLNVSRPCGQEERWRGPGSFPGALLVTAVGPEGPASPSPPPSLSLPQLQGHFHTHSMKSICHTHGLS